MLPKQRTNLTYNSKRNSFSIFALIQFFYYFGILKRAINHSLIIIEDEIDVLSKRSVVRKERVIPCNKISSFAHISFCLVFCYETTKWEEIPARCW